MKRSLCSFWGSLHLCLSFIFCASELLQNIKKYIIDVMAKICKNENGAGTHNKKCQRKGALHRMDFGKGMIPIEKNKDSEKRIILITDTDGNEVGRTYPKRARGLVKKGRARFVNDTHIRLNASEPVKYSEVNKMDQYTTINQESEAVRLYFNPRTWKFNKDCPKNVGNRMFLEGPDGKIAEGFILGDWGWNWTEIISETMMLEKNRLHTFSFWLNGGENDKNNEVCRFEVIFNNDHENRYSFNLNRNFIRPVLKLNNWELYEIPFMTLDNEYTQLRFSAQAAYMTVMAAGPREQYLDIPDHSDPYAKYRPQRHNIVFDDGFPTNTWYSTEKLEQKYGAQSNAERIKSKAAHIGERVSETAAGAENVAKRFQYETIHAATAAGQSVKDFFQKNVDMDSLKSAMTELKDKIMDIVSSDPETEDMDDLQERMDDIADQMDDISGQMDDIADQIDDVSEQLENLQESEEDED